MTSDQDVAPVVPAPEGDQDTLSQLVMRRVSSENEPSKRSGQGKTGGEKGNLVSNMIVETETVNTSSSNLLPIGHELIPKGGAVKKENNGQIDDSNETFLYDNTLQTPIGAPGVLQLSQQGSLLPVGGVQNINLTALSGPSGGLTNTGTTTGGNAVTGSLMSPMGVTTNQSFMGAHSTKSSGMRKPRFTQRNGSIHSVQQGMLPLMAPADTDSVSPTILNFSIHHGSHTSGNESSLEFNTGNISAQAGKYSDNEDDEDFDSSTYDARSQFSATKSNHSPNTSKQTPSRRVASMKLSQPNNWSQGAKSKPYNSLPQTAQQDGAPQLRTITSRLFDSKGTLPRRYSGLPPDVDFDDFDDDELDDFGFDYQTRNRPEEDEAEVGSDYRFGGNKKISYGSINYGNDFSSNNGGSLGSLNRLKKFKRNNDIYYSPHDFPNSKGGRWKQFSNFCYTFLLIVVLLFLGFVSGFLFASTKDLQAVQIIDVTEVIISQEELVFNMIVDGFNPGFINIEIHEVEIEVFAKSSHVHEEYYRKYAKDGIFETVLLGSITELNIPLKFQGGFFSRQNNIAISEVKILNPCSNDSEELPPTSTLTVTSTTTHTQHTIEPTSSVGLRKEKERPPTPGEEKWHSISQHPFDLIIRGVFKYNLPILNQYKTVGVNKIVTVDPDNLNL